MAALAMLGCWIWQHLTEHPTGVTQRVLVQARRHKELLAVSIAGGIHWL